MSLFRLNRLRWEDYTRDAPANQLDDGIGETPNIGTMEQSTHILYPRICSLMSIDAFVESIRSSNRFVIMILA